MKLTQAQAIATILDIQIVDIPETPDKHAHQIFQSKYGEIDVKLGEVGVQTLSDAIHKKINCDPQLLQASNFAVFPITSNREDFYMTIEREMLAQEQVEGKQLWEIFDTQDPRPVVQMIMSALRDCAVAVIDPMAFQRAMLKVGCIVIASIQWTHHWIANMRIRQAHLQSQRKEPYDGPNHQN